MSEYYVRWRFAPNTLLNNRDKWTDWIFDLYPDKDSGLKNYIDLLPVPGIEVKIYEMVELVPGQEEKDKETPEVRDFLDKQDLLFMSRNERIMKLFNEGASRREIATLEKLSYQTVYAVTKKYGK